MVPPRFICLLIALDFIVPFQVVRGVDEYSIQRFDLSPTGSLLEEQRQRNLLQKHVREGQQRRRKRRRLTIPDNWLHPYVNAIYATLQWPLSNITITNTTTNEDGTREKSPYNEDHEALIEFHGMRHWSRYERAFQQEHQRLHGVDSSPLRHDDIDWYEYYYNEDASVHSNGDESGKHNRTVGGSRLLSSSIPTSPSSLYGGKFNHYQAVPLSQGYGTHYINLWVGSPTPQRQTVIADTGSHFTAFPCVGCHKCGAEHHTDPYFNPEQSETFHALQCNECVATTTTCDSSSDAGLQRCQFTQSYTEGSSWKAYQARDLVYGGGQDVLHAANMQDNQMAIPFLFGCLTSETGLFVTQLADGIMGMSAHELTLVKQLYNAGKLEHNMFAMCFRRELGTSKRGVTAGSMTLGGVSSTLDLSPMVYAKNIQPYGWFTVFVKGIYIAKNGGKSFVFNKNDGGDDNKLAKLKKNIIKVPLDLAQVNSGKGVIVDSGTTDTYLSKSLAKQFSKIWKKVTGMEYTHAPIYLTQNQLHRLPTILVQCQSATGSDGKPKSAPYFAGQAGDLDPDSPQDLLLSIPATHYMEYSPALKLYTSRLYFTETRGGVLGANAMQGHNTVFDWENGRIGFAQSTCAYDNAEETMSGSQSNATSSTQQREGYARDCRLSAMPAVLTTQCVDTVDVRLCLETDQPTNVALMGTQIWTRLVETPGTRDGKSCVEAARQLRRQELVSSPSSSKTGASMSNLPSEFACIGDGSCLEYRPCEVSCQQVLHDYELKKKKELLDSEGLHSSPELSQDIKSTPTTSTNHFDIDESKSTAFQVDVFTCGDSYWSACDTMCKQTRILSVPDPNKDVCVESSRQSRTCHIDACGRNDPCRVPFLVHATFALRGGSAREWTAQSLDLWQRALFQTAHMSKFFKEGHQRWLFQPGDIDVLSARPWWQSETEEEYERVDENDPMHDFQQDGDAILGMVVVFQISIYNDRAHDIYANQSPYSTHTNGGESNATRSNQDKMTSFRPPHLRRLQSYDTLPSTFLQPTSDNTSRQRHLLQEIGDMVRNMTIFQRKRVSPETTCKEADLYPLAKDAVLLATSIFQHADFVSTLVGTIKQLEIKDGVESSPERAGPNLENRGEAFNDTSSTSPFSAVYGHHENLQSSRVLSSWPVGTQIYDSQINYFGPIAATPYIFFLRVSYEASVIFLIISLASMVVQNLSRYCKGFKGASKPRHSSSVTTSVIVRTRRLYSNCCFASCWRMRPFRQSKNLNWFSRSSARHSYEAASRHDNGHCDEVNSSDDYFYSGSGCPGSLDDDDSSLSGTIMGSLLRSGRNSKKDDAVGNHEIELAYSHSVSDGHAERRSSTTKRRNSMPLQNTMAPITIPTSLSG